MRHNFSLIARYSLKFTRCLLLVVKSVVARCKICSLLVVEVTRCKKITRYPLQKLLVAKNYSLLVAKFARYSLQKLLVAKNNFLLVAKFARYSLQKMFLQKITGFSLQNSLILIAKNHSSLKQSPAGITVCLKSTKLDESFSFICFLGPKNSKLLKPTYYAEICCYQNIV